MSSRSAIGAALCVLLGCRHAPAPERVSAPEAAAAAAADALEHALARYHETGAIDPLRSWVEAHPDHEDIGVWREFVALRIYESIVIGDPQAPPEPIEDGEDPAIAPLPAPDPTRLTALVHAYPDTIGGQTAQSLLEDEGLRRLSEPAINPTLIRFLEGGDDWALMDGGVEMPNVDLHAFRERHEARLRDRVASRLIADRCKTLMGYCNWWTARYPDDHLTAEIRVSMKAVWYKRAHPRWRSSNHANCSFHCARRCRQSAQPLDDSCFDPCFARCG